MGGHTSNILEIMLITAVTERSPCRRSLSTSTDHHYDLNANKIYFLTQPLLFFDGQEQLLNSFSKQRCTLVLVVY